MAYQPQKPVTGIDSKKMYQISNLANNPAFHHASLKHGKKSQQAESRRNLSEVGLAAMDTKPPPLKTSNLPNTHLALST